MRDRGGAPYAGLPQGARWVDFGLRALDPSSSQLKGAPIWVSDFLGAQAPKRLVLLVFFATWCEPCFATELPALAQWQERYGGSGLQVVAVNVRTPEQPLDAAMRQTARRLEFSPLPFPLLFDRTLRNQRVYLGEVASLPASFVLDSAGTIRRRSSGADAARLGQLECWIAGQLEAQPRGPCGTLPRQAERL